MKGVARVHWTESFYVGKRMGPTVLSRETKHYASEQQYFNRWT